MWQFDACKQHVYAKSALTGFLQPTTTMNHPAVHMRVSHNTNNSGASLFSMGFHYDRDPFWWPDQTWTNVHMPPYIHFNIKLYCFIAIAKFEE